MLRRTQGLTDAILPSYPAVFKYLNGRIIFKLDQLPRLNQKRSHSAKKKPEKDQLSLRGIRAMEIEDTEDQRMQRGHPVSPQIPPVSP